LSGDQAIECSSYLPSAGGAVKILAAPPAEGTIQTCVLRLSLKPVRVLYMSREYARTSPSGGLPGSSALVYAIVALSGDHSNPFTAPAPSQWSVLETGVRNLGAGAPKSQIQIPDWPSCNPRYPMLLLLGAHRGVDPGRT